MKVFLILWICIQDPSISLQSSCLQQPMPSTYDTVSLCLEDLKRIADDLYEMPDVYVSGFCTSKYLT